ncbi:MAG: prepilin-type N-terminal cleavage/methylation domain-containing protein [Candidatus Zapsychrus exili]|nr:prepilin-type N-terminal cleavage/methylation domain-containing protein [Candidatus Zapsychrus exili]
MRMESNKGFSLIEMMISLAIFSFIASGLYSILMVSNNSWHTHVANIDAQGQARLTADFLARELRTAEAILIIQDENSVNLSFSVPGADNVAYSWDKFGEHNDQLIRTTSENSRIVARDVFSLSIVEDNDEVLIDLMISVDKLEDMRGSDSSDIRIVRKVAKR